MPKRMISDAIWGSKKVRSVQPPEFRVEFAWILPIFEDVGVCEYDPQTLWSSAYASARPGWTTERVEAVLQEFIRVGLLLKYEAEGKTWCYLVGSDKEGFLPALSRRYSQFPLPPLGTVADSSRRLREHTPGTGTGTGFGTGSGSGFGSATGNGTGGGTGDGKNSQTSSVAGRSEENINRDEKNTVTATVSKDAVNNTVSSVHQSSSSTSPSEENINGNEKNTVKDTVSSVSEDIARWQVAVMCSLEQYLPVEWRQVNNSDLSKFLKTTPERFYAQMWWAFNKSDHWPTTLKTLEDVLRSYTTIANQYEKFYAKVPEHKRPHSLGIGIPKCLLSDDEDPFTVPEDQTPEEDKFVIPIDEEL